MRTSQTLRIVKNKATGTSHGCIIYSHNWLLVCNSYSREAKIVVFYIIHIRGAFSVARFDLPGNAKALTRGTSIRTGSTFFLFVCKHHLKLPVKKELLAKKIFHENNIYIIIYALSPVCCSEHGSECLNNWRL